MACRVVALALSVVLATVVLAARPSSPSIEPASQVLQGVPVGVPTITQHPVGIRVNAGDAAQFAVVAAAAATYRWQQSEDAGLTWTDVGNVPPYAGATTATLTVTSVGADLSGVRYRCLVENGAGVSPTLPATAIVVGGDQGDAIYRLLNQRVAAGRSVFPLFVDQDHALNMGFPSGFFASANPAALIHVDAGCVDDPAAPGGCAASPAALDRSRGTVIKIAFDPLNGVSFAGVNFEEPETWGEISSKPGLRGHNLAGATTLTFEARSPDDAILRFGIGNVPGGANQCQSPPIQIPRTWSLFSITIDKPNCHPALSDVHLLLTVLTTHPLGGTVFLDNVMFTPAPVSRATAVGLPVALQTFGVVPQQSGDIPFDQAARSVATTADSSMTLLALLARGTQQDQSNARQIADALDYARSNETQGWSIPRVTGGGHPLHEAYSGGDIALLNDQVRQKTGKLGEVRLGTFTSEKCPPTLSCLVGDGATASSSGLAILALVAASTQLPSGNNYLAAAEDIGQWVLDELRDPDVTGFGGFFQGFPSEGVPPAKPLLTGKLVDDNAILFAAFDQLSRTARNRGDVTNFMKWKSAAGVAGDFVVEMFDALNGRFWAGTVIHSPFPPEGVCADGLRRGNDVIDTCAVLAANVLPVLTMSGTTQYRGRIDDWRRPVRYIDATFKRTVVAGGTTFSGYSPTAPQLPGVDGVSWEATAQAALAMRYVDRTYETAEFSGRVAGILAELSTARTRAPFADGRGLVASTIPNGESVLPAAQCFKVPFRCIPERVALGASVWGVTAERFLNLLTLSPFLMHPTDRAAIAGASVSFKAAMAGVSPPAIRWQTLAPGSSIWKDVDDGVGVSGATSTTLTLSGVSKELHGFRYRLRTTGTTPVSTDDALLTVDMLDNGDFSNGLSGWERTSAEGIDWQVVGGTLRFHELTPPDDQRGQAAVFRRTGVAAGQNETLIASFDLGNTGQSRRRLSVLLHDAMMSNQDFADVAVCTFWLESNSAPRTYQMRAHPTRPWTNAVLSFYTATPGDDGDYEVDNVSLRVDRTGSATRNECIDPTVVAAGVAGPNLLINGGFDNGAILPWAVHGRITWDIAQGVFTFVRPGPPPSLPAGVVLQRTGAPLVKGQPISASFQLGNDSSSRQRVTVVFHDFDFSDLAACTFWLEPQQPLKQYSMQSFTTRAWNDATFAVYAATLEPSDAKRIRLDGVTFQRASPTGVIGTQCVEPAIGPLAQGVGRALQPSVVSAAASWPTRVVLRSAGPANDTSQPDPVTRTVVAIADEIDLTASVQAFLTFESRLEAPRASGHVDASLDGNQWQSLATVTDQGIWNTVIADLSAFAGHRILLRFVVDDACPDTNGPANQWTIRNARIEKR